MRKVFISYDYDNDKKYKNMLLAWSGNEFPFFRKFKFEDGSTDISIKSTDSAVIKRAISRRMTQCDVFLLLVGKKTSRSAWCNWEIEKAKDLGLKLIAVKIESSNSTPAGIYSAGASWALKFSFDSIKKAMS